jgi:hypothetical protein
MFSLKSIISKKLAVMAIMLFVIGGGLVPVGTYAVGNYTNPT